MDMEVVRMLRRRQSGMAMLDLASQAAGNVGNYGLFHFNVPSFGQGTGAEQ
jgi:hypothetical protein